MFCLEKQKDSSNRKLWDSLQKFYSRSQGENNRFPPNLQIKCCRKEHAKPHDYRIITLQSDSDSDVQLSIKYWYV